MQELKENVTFMHKIQQYFSLFFEITLFLTKGFKCMVNLQHVSAPDLFAFSNKAYK